MEILLTLLLLFLAFQFSLGQEKVRMVDQFGPITCEEIRFRLQIFITEELTNKQVNRFVIISGTQEQPFQKYKQEQLIRRSADFLRYDANKITFLYGKDTDVLATEFWVSPKNIRPQLEAENGTYILPSNIKPYLFHKSSWIPEVCPETFSHEFYSKFLLANLNLNGKLVIHERNQKEFQKTRKEIFRDLVQKLKIPAGQLKTVYVKNKEPEVEYWIIPKK